MAAVTSFPRQLDGEKLCRSARLPLETGARPTRDESAAKRQPFLFIRTYNGSLQKVGRECW